MILNISPQQEAEFTEKVRETSGQILGHCYQCGLCAATCPMAFAMDLLPHQIIHLAQLGVWERIVDSRTAWLCAACFSCTARCPRGVDVARLMEAVRLLTLRKNISHVELSEIASSDLARLPQAALVSSFRSGLHPQD